MFDFKNMPADLEIVNLGSTFSKSGFDYNNPLWGGVNGFNFAGAPQTLKTDREILEKYQKRLNRNAIVVVVLICPFVFCVYDYTDERPSSFRRCIRYAKKTVKKLIPGKILKIRDKQAQLLQPHELAQKNADSRINSWMQEFHLQNVTTQAPTAELEEVFIKTRDELSKILALCKKCEFRPVLVSMPVAAEENQQFSDEFIQIFYKENITKVNTEGIPFLDYFRDPRFSDALLYENYTDCLNERGRRLFAEVLTEDLIRIGLWGNRI